RCPDIDEERTAVGNARRSGSTNRLFLLGGDEAARLVGEIFDAGGDDGAAMDAGQRALVAEVVKVLADGLCRHLETPREVFHHDPAGGAGKVEDFGLAMRQSGHGADGAAVCRCGQRGKRLTNGETGESAKVVKALRSRKMI